MTKWGFVFFILFSQKFDKFKVQIEYAKGSGADPDPHGLASKSKPYLNPHESQKPEFSPIKVKFQDLWNQREKSDPDPSPSKKGIRIRITVMRICNTGQEQ